VKDKFRNFLGLFFGRYATAKQTVKAEIQGEELAAFVLAIWWARSLPPTPDS
jgi:hypothetical protein